jgi:GNAT superfamily N-acetyltransferase
MAEVAVTTSYLEMTSAAELVPAECPEGSVRLLRITACPPSFYRELYRRIGRDYNWFRRYHWSDREIAENLGTAGVAFYVLYCGEGAAGFFELRAEGDEVEVVYLGLVTECRGRGLGKYLVTLALREAWAQGPARVWLHTCTLDHVAARAAYVARGMRVYREEVGVEPVLELEGVAG